MVSNFSWGMTLTTFPLSSMTLRVIGYSPKAVGAPQMDPFGSSSIIGGRAPDTRLQWTGGFEFSTSGSVSLVSTGSIILFVGAFFVLAPVFAKALSPLIQRYHNLSELPGMIPVVLVSMVLLFAAVAQNVGAPHLLGGFVAGIALSRRFFLPFAAALNVDEEFSGRIDEQMRPIIQLFTPIFFVMVGLSLDLSAVDWSSPFIWVFSIVLTVVAIVGKLAVGLLVPENY